MNYHTVRNETDEQIWQLIVDHAGEVFHTARGLEFSYTIKRNKSGELLGEMVIDRKEKTITRNTVLLAYEKAQALMDTVGCVSGPKKLGVFGASYLYPVFLTLGVCKAEP